MTWLNIALAFWGAMGWLLFWWAAVWAYRTKDTEWGYVVLLKPEGNETRLKTVWCSKATAARLAADADVVHS